MNSRPPLVMGSYISSTRPSTYVCSMCLYEKLKNIENRSILLHKLKKHLHIDVFNKLTIFGDPTGNRTRVARMRTWCPNR